MWPAVGLHSSSLALDAYPTSEWTVDDPGGVRASSGFDRQASGEERTARTRQAEEVGMNRLYHTISLDSEEA